MKPKEVKTDEWQRLGRVEYQIRTWSSGWGSRWSCLKYAKDWFWRRQRRAAEREQWRVFFPFYLHEQGYDVFQQVIWGLGLRWFSRLSVASVCFRILKRDQERRLLFAGCSSNRAIFNLHLPQKQKQKSTYLHIIIIIIIYYSGSMLGCKWDERCSDTPRNRRLLVRTPTCEKHLLGRGHTSIALGPRVVAHFEPPFL